MKVLFVLLLVLVIKYCSADTVTTTASSYSTNDPITILFDTSTSYLTVEIVVNSVQFAILTIPPGGISGTVSFTGFVTCAMGPNALVTQLNIVANTILPGNIVGPSTPIAVPPAYTFVGTLCVAYFTTPPNNPTDVGANASFPVTIFSTINFDFTFITLNGQFFCTITTLTPSGTGFTGSCTGFVPCYVPDTATFAIVGQVTGSPSVIYPGPTIDLTANPTCAPLFIVDPQSSVGCPGAYTPLTAITFSFQINPTDSIAQYTAFKIWASNPSFVTDVFIADVAGPLTVINAFPSTYLITEWVIPCAFDGAGVTTFTLSYSETLPSAEILFQFQQQTVTIGTNSACNVTLLLHFVDPCNLTYSLPDCSCANQSDTTPPCNVCPTCPVLSNTTSSSVFLPGDILLFYVQNKMLPSTTGPFGVISTELLYYQDINSYVYAVSSLFFYASNATFQAVGYKPIGLGGGTSLVNVTVTPNTAIIGDISAYTNISSLDDIWGIDSPTSTLFCGDNGGGGLSASINPASPAATIIAATVGPLGVWILDISGNIYNKSTNLCNDGTAWFTTLITGASLISSGASGLYYNQGVFGLYFLATPVSTPLPLPSGPSSVIFMRASTADDTLALIDSTNAVWILNGPTGTWVKTTLVDLQAVPSNLNNLYVYYQDVSSKFDVDHVTLGQVPYFNIIPTYSHFTLILESSLPTLTLFSSVSQRLFDACNNSLLAAWTIPSQYKGVGPVTAQVTYLATYPDGSTTSFTSSLTFTIGPTPLDVFQARNFCPTTFIGRQVVQTPSPLLGCSTCH